MISSSGSFGTPATEKAGERFEGDAGAAGFFGVAFYATAGFSAPFETVGT